MAVQPAGTVTLLFTDIEGSTRLLERLGPERYQQSLELHRRLLREAFERHGGYEVDYEGDAFLVAFARASDAVDAASEGQQALAQAEWPEGLPIRVRMGVHTGEPLAAPPKYVGLDVHKAARITAAGHGGQVLVSAATEKLLDRDLPVLGLGQHRLKDLSEPEPLFQLLIPGLQGEFPALKTLGNRPHNLPVVATRFIGREAEASEVEALLLDEGIRLLTLTGTGGIGKTRLALQAAANVTEAFEDGVFWVPFAPVRDPMLLAGAIAGALGLREEPREATAETVARYLSGKRLLLLLDNLEHVLYAARMLMSSLLRAAPAVRVLATSREALRISGERLYEVMPLAVPEAGDERVADSDAVALFTARAQAADQAFTVDEGNLATVVEVLRRLDGLPLAIELAAARIRALPPQALLSRLDDRLRLLTSGPHDADERQRTLRATIGWSYELLTREEQSLFAGLGVFVAGFRLEAAEAVCAGAAETSFDVFDGISSLLDKSLIRRREDADRQPRYWMLETIRSYSNELSSVEVEERFIAWGADVAARSRFLAEAGDSAGMQLVQRELSNLRAALALALETQPATAITMIEDLRPYWWTQSPPEGLEWARRGLKVSTPETRSIALGSVATLARLLNDPLATEAAHERLGLALRHGDELEIVASRVLIANLAADEGDFATATTLFDEALLQANRLGDRRIALSIQLSRGENLVDRGRAAESFQWFQEALEEARTHRLEKEERHAIEGLGIAAVAAEQWEKAEPHLREALVRHHSAGDVKEVAICLDHLAACALARGDEGLATRLLTGSEAAWRHLGLADKRYRPPHLASLRRVPSPDLSECGEALAEAIAEATPRLADTNQCRR